MQFSDLYTKLLSYAGRSASDALTLNQAKDEINAACLWANRNKNFKYNEGYSVITYPANTQIIVPSNVCSAKILNIITCELLSATTDMSGVPLKIIEYSSLQRMRRKFDDVWKPLVPQYDYPVLDGTYNTQFQGVVQNTDRFIVCTIGNGFNLYPVPTQDTILLILFNKQLPLLVADSDTNFFLENCWDFILLRALKRMQIYMKDTTDAQISDSELMMQWKSICAWDAQLRTTGGSAGGGL